MAVREGLLALIDEGPRYGYELKTEFDAATGGVWSLNVGQVYTTLDRLERDGLVSVRLVDADDGGEPQKHYELTNAGRAELAAWWSEVPPAKPARDELLLKVMIAVQHSRQVALDVITLQRSALTSSLQRWRLEQRSLRTSTDATTLAAELISEALVRRTEADLRWLDQSEAAVLAAPDDAFSINRPTAPPAQSSPGDPIAETATVS